MKRRYSLPTALGFAIVSCALSVAPSAAATQSTTVTVTVTKNATANISLSGTAFTWANVQDNTNQFLAADGGALTVTGAVITKIGTGSGSIAIAAPANISGTGGGTLPISDLSITCSGGVVTGQSFATAHTALAASSSTNCATFGANFDTALNFTLGMFLDDRTIPADSYPATNFTVVATAT